MTTRNEGTNITAVHSAELAPFARDQIGGWNSGWFGINAYGHSTHGFAEMAVGAAGDPWARIEWLAPNHDVHEAIRLRYDQTRMCVVCLICFDDGWQFEPTDEQSEGCETDPDQVDTESKAIPRELYQDFTRLCTTDQLYPEELFTRMAALFFDMFEVLPVEQTRELEWDHHWHRGPSPTSVWRPVDLGNGLDPFAVRASSPEVPQP